MHTSCCLELNVCQQTNKHSATPLADSMDLPVCKSSRPHCALPWASAGPMLADRANQEKPTGRLQRDVVCLDLAPPNQRRPATAFAYLTVGRLPTLTQRGDGDLFIRYVISTESRPRGAAAEDIPKKITYEGSRVGLMFLERELCASNPPFFALCIAFP
jgi:hypothetical protein